MALTGQKTFVGFGFGAIQAGLFLYEAYQSDNFGRLVVAEIMPEVVDAIRREGGYYAVNIANTSGVEHARIGEIQIEDPAQALDRGRLISAVAEAQEIATAVPSVDFYVSEGDKSLHRILAAGLRQKAAQDKAPVVIYTAENHNLAAEMLESEVFAEIPPAEYAAVRGKVSFVNTVIGKMSGVIIDPGEIKTQQLLTTTPDDKRAFLVEAFNHILITETQVERGISVFEQKPDLLPFEEAKLYGHNAGHALAAYLGRLRGVRYMADLRAMPELMAFLHAAMVEESGGALSKKYAHVDPLFTSAGFAAYSENLLERMTNPYLRDTVERVGRDPVRKLSWNDRLIGTMRLCLHNGIQPRRYAMGVAAAVATMDRAAFEADAPLEKVLDRIWLIAEPDPEERAAMLLLIEEGRAAVRQWIKSGFGSKELV